MATCNPYVKTNWVNGTAPAINADHLNNIEQGLDAVTNCAIDHETRLEIIENKDAFVTGMIIMFSGTIIPQGWSICDGTNGTPDLRDTFIMGSDITNIGATGGYADAAVIAHNHTLTGSIASGGAHTHKVDLWDAVTSGEGPKISAAGGNTPMFTDIPEVKSAGAHTHSHTLAVGTSGGSGTNRNLPPYYKLAYIMKV